MQNLDFKVALVTDGRMSGASGKVPAAIHLSPEANDNPLLAKIKDGDLITLDCEKGILHCDGEAIIAERQASTYEPSQVGSGRELFDNIRALLSSSETGATIF